MKKATLIISILKSLIIVLGIKHFLSFKTLITFLKNKNPSSHQAYEHDEVRFSLNFVFNKLNINNCLTSASVIYVALNKHGFRPKLFIGFSGTNSDFHSHGWVECEGKTYHTNPVNLMDIKKIIEIVP